MLTKIFRQKVLALCVRSEEVFRYRHIFKRELFHEEDGKLGVHSIIAGIIEECFQRGDRPDADTVEFVLQSRKQQFHPGVYDSILKEWQEIKAVNTSDANTVVDTFVRIVSELEMRVRVRKIYEAIQRTDSSGGEFDVDGAYEYLGELQKYRKEAPSGRFWIDSSMPPEFHWLSKQKYRIPTGFDSLDEALRGGFPKGEFFVFLAPPKGGKSAILASLAVNAAFLGYKVAFFSYEMSIDDMLRRFDRSISMSSGQEIMSNISILKNAYDAVRRNNGNIWIEELRQMVHGPADASLRIKELINSGFVPDLVILDYLNLMSIKSRRVEKRHELAEIARMMSAMAKEFRVVLLSACLVKRDAVGRKEVRKVDIAESFEVIAVVDGAIAIAADDVMLQNNMRSLYLAAMRDAQDERYAGTYMVDFERMTFTEIKENQEMTDV